MRALNRWLSLKNKRDTHTKRQWNWGSKANTKYNKCKDYRYQFQGRIILMKKRSEWERGQRPSTFFSTEIIWTSWYTYKKEVWKWPVDIWRDFFNVCKYWQRPEKFIPISVFIIESIKYIIIYTNNTLSPYLWPIEYLDSQRHGSSIVYICNSQHVCVEKIIYV